ncbi:MAG TPA: 3-dehydroquinate synthase [Anaerolineales bacterium]|nr:3-dehydroquinate synthase [Anaerolineales bacterium]
MNIILYGPPGVGKTTVGKELAIRLGRAFFDSDPMIENYAGRSIPHTFSQLGEAEFRRLESKVCAELAAWQDVVIALGGGALLNPNNRAAFERNGLVVCLRASADELLNRVGQIGNLPNNRPLLAGDNPAERLNALLHGRRALYDSFPVQLDTTNKPISQVVSEIESLLAPRTLPVHAPGLKHEIVLGYGLLDPLPDLLDERGLTGPMVIVTDENVAPFIVHRSSLIVLPAGEQHKTLDTICTLYDAFLKHGLDRSGIVIAIGGGVIGDMAGFAAATFMRGVRWVNAPTTLLAMVDASLGGKTGVDLPNGKNLVGAFHPPSLVVSDPLTLNTLPHAERVSGMAEVIKHGIIGDAGLFEAIEAGAAFGSVEQLQRAIAVKIRVVEADPFEKGERATLNLGHTIGHGVEAASGYKFRHGEAVAIGLAAESQLAEGLGLAEGGLAQRIARACTQVGLPVNCPGLNPVRIREAMSSDKKKAGGRLKFALPKRIGEVTWGVEADEDLLLEVLKSAAS